MMKSKEKTDCAVILAAGYGERFLPLTEKIAKPAIPFLNKPMICWTVKQLIDYGVKKIFVNLHHLPNSIKKVLLPYKKKAEIIYSFEKEILGTYGLFFKIKDLLPEKFFVINSDVFMKMPLSEMDEVFQQKGNFNALLLLRKKRKKDKYTSFSAKEDTINKIGKGDLHFCGMYIAQKNFLKYANEEKKMELIDVLKEELKIGSLGGFIFNDEWLDLGTPEEYLKSTEVCLKRIAEGKMKAPKGNTFSLINGFPILSHRNTFISPIPSETKVKGFLVLGKNSKLAVSDSAKNVVVLENCIVQTKKAENAIFYKNGCLCPKMDKTQNKI